MTLSGDWGTLKFNGSGSSSALGAVDDVTPNAYEEVWDTTTGADERIDGRSGNNLLTYNSPSFNGVMFKVGHQQADTSTATDNSLDVGSYTDFGIQITPEMVEGLSIGYAQATLDDTATTEIDHENLWVKYAVGGFTFGYQTIEADGSTADKNDESTSWGISYAVNDDITISYNESSYDDGTQTTDQENSAFGISYTMGSIKVTGILASMDNVGGSTATIDDVTGYEIGMSFTF